MADESFIQQDRPQSSLPRKTMPYISWHSRSEYRAEPYSATSESTVGSCSVTRAFTRTRTRSVVE
jgi:hypothetical protein